MAETVAAIGGEQHGFEPSHVARIEEAAAVLMSPTITPEARKAAEQFFLNIRNDKLSPEYCRLVIESTCNEFVVFEMVQVLVLNLFKQWSILEPPLLRQCFEYLMENAVHKFRGSKLIRGEMLRGCAKLLKRSIFDDKACDADTLDKTIHFLLTNSDPQLQAVACEFIEAITAEFSSCWMTANLGITFDFQLRARRKFESEGLQRLFEKCIRTFSEIVYTADLTSPYYMGICENFLRVADMILSWNFEIHRLLIRVAFVNEATPAAALRPPESWKPIFQSNDFLRLFFELHKRVRCNETLCVHSVNCLIQLSSLMGPVLMDDVPVDTAKTPIYCFTSVNAYDRYVANFLAGFVDIFNSGPSESELLGICLMVYKVLTYHRILSIARADASLPKFVVFLVNYIEHLTPIAMQKTLEEDDNVYLEGLQHLYNGWWVLLRNSDIIIRTTYDTIEFEQLNFTVISAFMRAVLSKPLGNRVKIPIRECDEEHDEDDREIYKELLENMGRFISFYCAQMLPRMFTLLHDKLQEFISFVEKGVSDDDLNLWREDMHWILLLNGSSLTVSEEDGSTQLQSEVFEYCDGIQQRETVDANSCAAYIKACIDSPNAIDTDPQHVYPFVKILGAVLAWSVIEHKLLMEHGPESVSPELVRTTLWCMKRIAYAVGAVVLSEDSEQMATVIRAFSPPMVDFAVEKSFAILNRLSGEKKLCMDAVELLVGIARTQPNDIANSALFFPCLTTVQIERLSARHSLLRVLVQIGASADDENMQKTLCNMILEPLRQRYLALCNDRATRETDLVDLLECFRGVAEAALSYSTHFLFEYLRPVLTCTVGLLAAHKESQFITNAVLEFFNVVTRRMGVYSEDRSDVIFLYEALIELVRVYQTGQFMRYKVKIDVDVEEKATDLILLLDILGNVMSKDIVSVSFSDAEEFTKCGFRVALLALEMLLPLMDDDLLKLPSLCKKFYRFILYFTEMGPQYIEHLPETMFTTIVECLRHGLKSIFGHEVAMMSAEAANEIACYLNKHKEQKNASKIALVATLIEPAFAMCLSNSWQVELQNASATAVFSLICCNKDAFEEYVNHLLDRPENRPYNEVLKTAFENLFPSSSEFCLGRRERRAFHDRLEKFLNQVQGLLVVE